MSDEKLLEAVGRRVFELSRALEQANIAEWIELYRRPARLIYLNFAAGLARGFGMAVGFTVIGAVFLIVIGKLAALNLPVIGRFIAEVVSIVQLYLRTGDL